MKLTILGSGSAFIAANRAATGMLLEIKKDIILIDCGYGVSLRLKQAGHDPLDLTPILITHTHTDHFSDLIALLWSRNWGQSGNIQIIGPQGLTAFFNKLQKIMIPGVVKRAKWNLKIEEANNRTIKFKKWYLGSFVLPTTQPFSLIKKEIAYKISTNNKSFAYTGDTNPNDFNNKLIKFLYKIDVLMIECSTPKKSNEHLWPEMCGKIAQKIQPKKLILTHISPEVEKINIKKIASKYYKGQIIIAKDLMQIKI